MFKNPASIPIANTKGNLEPLTFPAAENKKSVETFCSSVIVSNAIEGFAPTVKPAPTAKSLENVNKKTKDNTVI